MAEPVHQSQNPTAKGQILNDRTYQEVEYLKKNLGPILVAALAEICIRRPADPIEYLGHWLLRWRYNEELKRRDVQNALEVVRQKAWTKDDENMQPAADQFGQGFTPGTPNGPPGFGGPLDAATIEEGTARKSGEASAAPPVEGSGSSEKRPSQEQAEKRPSQAAGSGEMRRASQGSKRGSAANNNEAERTPSGEQPAEVEKAPSEGAAAIEERRSSRKSAAETEVKEKEPSGEAIPPPAEEAPAPPAEEPAAAPAEDSTEPEPANE